MYYHKIQWKSIPPISIEKYLWMSYTGLLISKDNLMVKQQQLIKAIKVWPKFALC